MDEFVFAGERHSNSTVPVALRSGLAPAPADIVSACGVPLPDMALMCVSRRKAAKLLLGTGGGEMYATSQPDAYFSAIVPWIGVNAWEPTQFDDFAIWQGKTPPRTPELDERRAFWYTVLEQSTSFWLAVYVHSVRCLYAEQDGTGAFSMRMPLRLPLDAQTSVPNIREHIRRLHRPRDVYNAAYALEQPCSWPTARLDITLVQTRDGWVPRLPGALNRQWFHYDQYARLLSGMIITVGGRSWRLLTNHQFQLVGSAHDFAFDTRAERDLETRADVLPGQMRLRDYVLTCGSRLLEFFAQGKLLRIRTQRMRTAMRGEPIAPSLFQSQRITARQLAAEEADTSVEYRYSKSRSMMVPLADGPIRRPTNESTVTLRLVYEHTLSTGRVRLNWENQSDMLHRTALMHRDDIAGFVSAAFLYPSEMYRDQTPVLYHTGGNSWQPDAPVCHLQSFDLPGNACGRPRLVQGQWHTQPEGVVPNDAVASAPVRLVLDDMTIPTPGPPIGHPRLAECGPLQTHPVWFGLYLSSLDFDAGECQLIVYDRGAQLARHSITMARVFVHVDYRDTEDEPFQQQPPFQLQFALDMIASGAAMPLGPTSDPVMI